MGWRHLDPAQVARELRAAVEGSEADGEELAEFALAHLRSRLLDGEYVVVQDDEGHTFIGTLEEATQHMMEGGGDNTACRFQKTSAVGNGLNQCAAEVF